MKFLINPRQDIVTYFAFEKEAKICNRWMVIERCFFKNHPKLKKIKAIKDKEARRAILKNYLDKRYKMHRDLMIKRAKDAERQWGKILDDFFRLSEKLFGKHRWPVGNYRAIVTIWDIFPRFISQKIFQFPYKGRAFKRVEFIIAHEMLHFIFYDYVCSGFPRFKQEKFSYPLWVVSEAFNEAIMQEPEWKRIFPNQGRPYRETSEIRRRIRALRKKNETLDVILDKCLLFAVENYPNP